MHHSGARDGGEQQQQANYCCLNLRCDCLAAGLPCIEACACRHHHRSPRDGASDNNNNDDDIDDITAPFSAEDSFYQQVDNNNMEPGSSCGNDNNNMTGTRASLMEAWLEQDIWCFRYKFSQWAQQTLPHFWHDLGEAQFLPATNTTTTTNTATLPTAALKVPSVAA